MKLDILAFGAHPDDIEFSAGGTLCKAASQGKSVGIIDLTHGELGTRGTAKIRDQEAADAAKILGLKARENLGFRDCFFKNDEEHQFKVLKMIRKYQPDIILTNSDDKRHPDHARGEELVRHAAFLSGLVKIETGHDPWRPKRIFQYIQVREIQPSFIVDIDGYFDKKIEVMKAYKSQVGGGDIPTEERETIMTHPDFWHFIERRAKSYGQMIGATYGEGFVASHPPKIDQLTDLI